MSSIIIFYYVIIYICLYKIYTTEQKIIEDMYGNTHTLMLKKKSLNFFLGVS